MARKRLRARTPIELAVKIYAAEGWTRKAGEKRWTRIREFYDLTIQGNLFVATPRKGN